MTDYRLPEHRAEYFSALYKMNLEHGVMPGLVYLYMPKLAEHYGWGPEERLWFATINGFTQNPITSLRIFQQLPECPPAGATLAKFETWFNDNWATLQFDTDRVKNKRNTVAGVRSYADLVAANGSQAALWATGQPYEQIWAKARGVHSFGRLSAFSYLEYVRIMGYGADCDDLMFEDKEGSKSHRNGALFLQGLDHMVWDKRAGNGFDGNYEQFDRMCSLLASRAAQFLGDFRDRHPEVEHVGNFTLESQYCQFKNGFFRRRFPGVYADMAQERIEWYDLRGMGEHTEVFKDIRAAHLPDWLRAECEPKPIPKAIKAAKFHATGAPFRWEYFL